MMLFTRLIDIDAVHTRPQSTFVMPAARHGRSEIGARTGRSRSERGQTQTRGQSRGDQQRSLNRAGSTETRRQKRRVQAEDDGAVLLCRD